MIKPSEHKLTWRKSALLVIVTLCISMILCIYMIAQRISLISSIYRYTIIFYLILGVAPGILVMVLCALKRPSGSRVWIILLPMLSAMLFCVYLGIIGPSYSSEIKCNPPSQSGLFTHQDCICIWTGSSDKNQVMCSLDSLKFSPFARLTEH
jgi:hypothetical protein